MPTPGIPPFLLDLGGGLVAGDQQINWWDLAEQGIEYLESTAPGPAEPSEPDRGSIGNLPQTHPGYGPTSYRAPKPPAAPAQGMDTGTAIALGLGALALGTVLVGGIGIAVYTASR